MANKHQVLFLRTKHPEMTVKEIARQLGCLTGYVRATISRANAEPKVYKRPGCLHGWTKEEDDKLKSMRAEKQRWKLVSRELGRPLSTCAARYRELMQEKIGSRLNVVERPRVIPDEVVADAIRRNTEPRDITSEFFGDPPFSQSALAKKQGAYA